MAVNVRKPVEDPTFWKDRIYDAVANRKELHEIIYQEHKLIWWRLQSETAEILHEHISAGSVVLDAGCGYGALADCLQDARLLERIRYVGVDISPDLIDLAQRRYPSCSFSQGDLRHLEFPDKAFDWVICRAVERMIRDNIGDVAWEVMHTELRRVGKRILFLDYPTDFETPVPWHAEDVSK